MLKHPARAYTGGWRYAQSKIHTHVRLQLLLQGTWTLFQHRIRAALLAGTETASSNTRTHPYHLHEVEHWNLATLSACLRIAGRRGLLNRHRTTGGLLASPVPCTAGTSAPSQTCYQWKNVRKGWMPDNLGFKVKWQGEGQDARSLPFRYTVFTKDMFAAQKNGDMHLLLAYRAHISSSNDLNTHNKV